jgi:hypothetical protein
MFTINNQMKCASHASIQQVQVLGFAINLSIRLRPHFTQWLGSLVVIRARLEQSILPLGICDELLDMHIFKHVHPRMDMGKLHQITAHKPEMNINTLGNQCGKGESSIFR